METIWKPLKTSAEKTQAEIWGNFQAASFPCRMFLGSRRRWERELGEDYWEGLFRKRYLGTIWEMARAAAISGRPGGTECDLSKILEADEHGTRVKVRCKSEHQVVCTRMSVTTR